MTPRPTAGSPSDVIHALRYTAGEEAVCLFCDLLAGHDILASAWINEEEDLAIVSVYTESRHEAESLADRISSLLVDWAEVLPAESLQVLGICDIPREDWAESWKQYFHPRRVSERLVIKPSWEAYRPAPGELVVELDPGMSFGTGQHATTVSCLRLLDRLAADGLNGPVLDMGCGSGVLSIAAVKLGFAPVEAFDVDPIAVEAAGENCRVNHVADQVNACKADLASWHGREGGYAVVVANILAPILTRHAAAIAGSLRPDGEARLILSGILTTQFAAVAAAYRSAGLEVIDTLVDGEWTTGLCCRR